MADAWNWYIGIIAVANILACVWLIRWTAKKRPNEGAAHETTGHEWDGLQELNHPMPRWWLWLFYITIVFALVYLVLYPGFGNFNGLTGWSQYSAWEEEVAATEERVAPLYAEYAETPIPELAENDDAMQTGRRLFGNNCAVCHGVDAGGRPGFPDLTNDHWSWGGEPGEIYTTILEGRRAVMPALGDALGEEGVEQVAAYVFSLNGRDAPEDLVSAGEEVFQQQCVACHAADGTGRKAMGAPNLADDEWIYGGSVEAIRTSVREGRRGVMPAQGEALGEDRVHVLAAYVYSLSRDERAAELAQEGGGDD